MSTYQPQTKNQTQTQNAGKKPVEQNFIIVDFLDLNTSFFSFGDVKDNKYGGHIIPLKYKEKSLYVKTPARVCPFGITAGKEEKPEYKGKYPDSKKITGYSAAISFPKEYENDPYYIKAAELDEFFIDQCHKHSMAWCLGGTKQVPMERRAVVGYDEKGLKGLWKRIVKWSYKDDAKTKERTYQPYPPRMDFGVPTTTMTEYTGADGLLVQEAIFKTTFFDTDGTKLEPVSSTEAETVMPKFSRVSSLAQWSSITQGTYGASLKPKAQQFRVYPSEGLPDADNCYLEDADDDAAELPDMLGGIPAEVVIQQRPSTALPKSSVAVPSTALPKSSVAVPSTALPKLMDAPSAKLTPVPSLKTATAPKGVSVSVKKPSTPEPVDDELVDEGGDLVEGEEASSDVEREPTPEPIKPAPLKATRRTIVAKNN